MKKLLLPLLTLLILIGAACNRTPSADAGDLLATVPSDAASVAVANLRSLLEKADCKIDGSRIEPGEDAMRVAQTLPDEKSRRLATLFLSGKSGIQPSAAVIFTEGDALYFLSFLADPDMFRKAVSEEWGGSFSSQSGIEINNNVAVKGNLSWVRLDGRSIEATDINRFSSLSERQSILSSPLSESIVEIDKDIEGWGNIAGLIAASGMEFTQRGMLTMALQTLLEDPSDILFTIDFQKGEAKATATILNSKGKTAKLLIPSGKIDPATMKSVSGTGNYIMAAALPQKLIKDLTKEIKGKGPSLLGVVLQAISPLDGTTAIIGTIKPAAVTGVISTTGENLVGLTDLLNEMDMKVTRDGKFLRIASGTPSGELSMETSADTFKGAMAGVMVAGNPKASSGENTGKSTLFPTSTAILLIPSNGGMTLSIEASASRDCNFLLSLLKNI